jgi:hypothetical protein
MSDVSDQRINSVANFVGTPNRNYGSFFAKDRARMTTFLLAGRQVVIDTRKSRFLS